MSDSHRRPVPLNKAYRLLNHGPTVLVIAAHADERVFSDGRWHFEGHDGLRTLHHVAGGDFLKIGDAVDGKTLAV
uniref:hypothetical protein n=1 Tax=Pseudomonas sp. EA_5y_Pfl2_R50 TaxID=3088691 RepID=UPI0030DA9A9B